MAMVNWVTDVPATSCVAYGLTSALGSLSDIDPTLTIEHSVIVYGLTPNTSYDFSVISDDVYGQQSSSEVSTWTTLADTTPPVTSFTDGPADGTTACTADTTFTWTGTDDCTPTDQLVYAYSLDGNAWSDFTAQTSLNLAGLPDGQHTLSVAARDAAGNVDPNPPLRHFTLDATPPVITQVTGTPQAGTAVIKWSTDKPATSVVQYGADATYGTTAGDSTRFTTAHAVTLTGLQPLLAYHFSVTSADGCAHSVFSPDTVFTTTVDNIPPSAQIIAGPADGSKIDATSVTVSWTGTDDVTLPQNLLFQYRLDTYPWSDWGTLTTQTFTGLIDGVHTVQVRAQDQRAMSSRRRPFAPSGWIPRRR